MESQTLGLDKPQKRLKIVHLITSLEVGGAQHGLLMGLPRFDQSQYEHVIISIMDRLQMAPQFRDVGIQVITLGLNKKTDLLVIRRLMSVLGDLQPDILHTYLLHGNVLGRIAGRLVGISTIIGSERTIGQAKFWGRLATKLTNPLTNAVEVNSETGARAIVDSLGVPPDKIEIVKSGLDLDKFGKTETRNDIRDAIDVGAENHLVLYVGRLRRVKGVEYGIKAFAKAYEQRPRLRLALAGEGEQHDYLVDLTKDLGIDNQVTFFGVRNDLAELMSAADSVILPSLNEGFPRTAIEAMASGKPIVATKVGGTPEAILDEETGILVPSRDSDAMSKALVKLVDSPDMCNELGLGGRRRALENYSVNTYVERLDTIYQKYSSRGNVNTNVDYQPSSDREPE